MATLGSLIGIIVQTLGNTGGKQSGLNAINAMSGMMAGYQQGKKDYMKVQQLEFEKNFAAYCGVTNCIGVANGLDALILTLRAWKEMGKLQDGDEVIVPANTYIASVLAITENKLIPVFVEPEEKTFNLNPDLLIQAITPKTKVILPVSFNINSLVGVF